MERIGLLDRYPDGTFGLGLWLMELGALVEERLDLRVAASEELAQLRQATGLTVFMIVPHGHQATCIDRLAGSNVDVLALRLGGSLPLYCGAGPRVLLAWLSPEDQEHYLREAPFRKLTPHTLSSSAELRRDIARTRDLGYVLSMEDVTIGVAAVGAPIHDASGNVVATVSVAGLKHEFEGDAGARVFDLVRSTADRVSAALGRRIDRGNGATPERLSARAG
jgi:DNA-binding IclR family transcriptional regulator